MALEPCTDERREICRQEQPDPAHLAWSCKECKRIRPEAVNPYTNMLLRLSRLQKGGFDLKAIEMPLSTWLDLGAVAEALDMAERVMQWRQTPKHLI